MGNGYRYYGDDDLARLKKLQTLQAIGRSLDDIAHVLPALLRRSGWRGGQEKIIELLRRQLEPNRSSKRCRSMKSRKGGDST